MPVRNVSVPHCGLFNAYQFRLSLNRSTILQLRESNGAQAHGHMCCVGRHACPKTGKREFSLTAGLMGEVMQVNTEDWQMSRDVNTQRHLKSASPTDSRARCCCQLAFFFSFFFYHLLHLQGIQHSKTFHCARFIDHPLLSDILIRHFSGLRNAEGGGEPSAFLQGSLAFSESFHNNNNYPE